MMRSRRSFQIEYRTAPWRKNLPGAGKFPEPRFCVGLQFKSRVRQIRSILQYSSPEDPGEECQDRIGRVKESEAANWPLVLD